MEEDAYGEAGKARFKFFALDFPGKSGPLIEMSGTLTLNGRTYRITLTEMMTTDDPVNMTPLMQGGKKNKKNNTVQEGGKKTRKLSPYMRFAQKMRPELLKENPALKSDIPGMGRAIGAKWRALSEEEKKKY